MGLCKDKSITALRQLGYNVVRLPNAATAPLAIIGQQSREFMHLGTLNQLITNPPGNLPPITRDIAAADVNGKQSSKLSIGIGANILGALVGAMGGNLGVETSYTNARTIEFQYSDVLKDSVEPLAVGQYLRDAIVDAGNLILREYVLGRGKLFVITSTIKSKKFSVRYETSSGVAANVSIPAIKGLVGGSVKVALETGSTNVVSFEGASPLIFGFQCFRVYVEDGILALTSVKAGGVALSAGVPGAAQPEALEEEGLVEFTL